MNNIILVEVYEVMESDTALFSLKNDSLVVKHTLWFLKDDTFFVDRKQYRA